MQRMGSTGARRVYLSSADAEASRCQWATTWGGIGRRGAAEGHKTGTPGYHKRKNTD